MKIVTEFDTITKAATCTLDGVLMPNFQSYTVYADYKGKFYCEVTSGVENEDHDVRAMTRVCASSGELVEKDDYNGLDAELEKEILDSCGE